MPVRGSYSLTLEVPDVADGVAFYGEAGLVAAVSGDAATLQCQGQDHESIVLLGGFPRKRLHHITLRDITLRTDGLDAIAGKVPAAGGKVVDAPAGFSDAGLWMTDANGMLIQLLDRPADPLNHRPELAAGIQHQCDPLR